MDVREEIVAIVPGIDDGMMLEDALKLILKELLRLKEIEAMYEGLCK